MLNTNNAQKPLSYRQMLDTMIKEYYAALRNNKDNDNDDGSRNNKKDVKIGDFLKMIELRRKLAPIGADQRVFWNMLDKMRREEMNRRKRRTTGKRRWSRRHYAKRR